MGKETYRKRMKAGWNQGKRAKGDGEERQYAKREIIQQLREDEDTFFYKQGGRKRNIKASLEYQITWYTKRLEEAQKRDSGWFAGWAQSFLESAQKKYEKLYGKKFEP